MQYWTLVHYYSFYRGMVGVTVMTPARMAAQTGRRGRYYTILYCTVLYRTIPHCTVLYCTVLYHTIPHCTVLYCTVLYCTVLYSTLQYCTLLYCIVLYCTVLYSTLLYCTVLYCRIATANRANQRLPARGRGGVR